jgi:hypothetical protein
MTKVGYSYLGFCGFGDEGKVWRVGVGGDCQDILTMLALKLVKLGIFPKLRIFAGGWRGCKLGGVRDWVDFNNFFLKLVNFG